MRKGTRQASAARSVDDRMLVERIRARDGAAFEALMRRYNGRLFRVARAILKDDSEAEDVLQDAYLDAYRNMSRFRGDSQLSTWLVRIVANRALMRLRQQKRDRVVVPIGDRGRDRDTPAAEMPDLASESPTNAAARAEIR